MTISSSHKQTVTSSYFILPDSALALLVQAAEDESAAKFLVGDTVAELIDEFCTLDWESNNAIKAEIRRQASNVTGLAFDTVRDRERVARAVPVDLRGEYPLLGFHHWRALLSAGPRFHMYVRWAAAESDSRGKPPPVDEIYARIASAGDRISIPLWMRRTAHTGRLLGKLLASSSEDMPPTLRLALSVALRWINKTVGDGG